MQDTGSKKLSLWTLGILAAASGIHEVGCSSTDPVDVHGTGLAGSTSGGGMPGVGGGGGDGGDGGSGGAPCVPAIEICGNGIDEDCDGVDLPVASCLVSDGLIVRYFMDDVVNGTLPDSGPEPKLPLQEADPDGELASVGAPRHRGISWSEVGGNARVTAGFSNTSDPMTRNKMLLSGGQLTLELAASITAAGDIRGQMQPHPSRLLFIGTRTGDLGKLSLNAGGQDPAGNRTLLFSLDSGGVPQTVGAWTAPGAVLSKPSILHLVLDTAATEGDSVSLYLNGALVVNDTTDRPLADYDFDWIQPMWYFVIGNRELGGRAFKGSVSYAAMYGRALSSDEIVKNTVLLQQSDDGP